jgi:hypothetical protein
VSIVYGESLDCRRRANAEREDNARRLAGYFWRNCQNGPDKEIDGPVDRATENSRMGYGTNRTLMAWKLRIVSVDVDCLNDADERDQKDAQQRYCRYACISISARLVLC